MISEPYLHITSISITDNMTDPKLSAAASALGRRGGQSKSEAKIKASRENGKKGGRPKKIKWKSCEPPYIIKIDLEEIA